MSFKSAGYANLEDAQREWSPTLFYTAGQPRRLSINGQQLSGYIQNKTSKCKNIWCPAETSMMNLEAFTWTVEL